MKNKINYPKYLLGLFLVQIIMGTVFRIVSLFVNWDKYKVLDEAALYFLPKSFLIGVQFDIVMASYSLVLPFFWFFVTSFSRLRQEFIYIVANIIFLILFVPYLYIHLADIIYFSYFFDRMNTTVFVWFNTPKMVIKMLLTEWSYTVLLVIGILLTIGHYKLIKKYSSFFLGNHKPTLGKKLACFLLLPCLALGIRGRFKSKSPLREGSSYFSSYAFINKLALNPSFTFFNSLKRDLKNKKLELVKKEIAKEEFKNFYGESPRLHQSQKEQKDMNVILVIMESMSARFLARYGADPKLTPNLNDLNDKGISFNKAYTLGIHTFNGIFSTLFAWPSPFRVHPMKVSPIPKRQSFASELKKHGYKTAYFTTHDDQFDNAGGYLRYNGFEKVYHDSLYPADKIISTLGVPDHFLFEYMIDRADEVHKNGEKFAFALMTGSNHRPWTIPEGIDFKEPFDDPGKNIIAYADWSIGQLFKKAKDKEWFKNTLFVFVADHGLIVNAKYEMPISYNHTPLIFYHDGVEAQQIDKVASQMDVFPSILGYLGLPFENSTFGIDLFSQDRSHALINSDDKIALINKEYLAIWRENGSSVVYDLKVKEVKEAQVPEIKGKVFTKLKGLMQYSGF